MQTDPVTTPVSNPQPTQPAWDYENLRSYFIGGAIGFAAIFIIWGGITLAADLSQKQVQKEYLSLTDDASRAVFVKRYATHPLGALVLLGQANDYYGNGDYAAAQTAYAQVATSGLKNQPILLEEALLGQAFSSYALDSTKGIAALKAIAQNPALMQSTRAYAATELAGYYAKSGDFKQAKDYIQLVKTFKSAQPWLRQTASLGAIYPQLAEKKPSAKD